MIPKIDGLGPNLISDLLANLICVGVPALLAAGIYLDRRNRRLRFFGVTGRRPRSVQILLSNIWVKPAGTLSPSTRIGAGFAGSAITATEYEYALKLATKIQSQPFVGALSALAEAFRVEAFEPRLTCRIAPSADYLRMPTTELELTQHREIDFEVDKDIVHNIKRQLSEARAFVLVGSTVYNLLTRYVLTHSGEQSRVQFEDSELEPRHYASAIRVMRALADGTKDMPLARRSPPEGDTNGMYEEYFLVQKITDWQNTGVTIFICAGTSTAATAQAVETLVDWHKLRKRYGRRPFVIVRKLLTSDRDMPGGSRGAETKIGDVYPVWSTD